MKWINYLNYESNGLVIVFEKSQPLEGEKVDKYSFAVIGRKDLTEKLLKIVKEKRVKKANIPLCAENLFQLLEGNNNADVEKIRIFSVVVKKGPVEKNYCKINLIHQKGLISKSFTLFDLDSYGVLKDWKDIFDSNLQEDYSNFLKQFDIEMPKELLKNDHGAFQAVLIKFQSNFEFKY